MCAWGRRDLHPLRYAQCGGHRPGGARRASKPYRRASVSVRANRRRKHGHQDRSLAPARHFYRKPAPDQPPYKNEGDRVAIGDIDRPVEVMKILQRGEGGRERKDRELPSSRTRTRSWRASRSPRSRSEVRKRHANPQAPHRQPRRDRRAHHPRGARTRHPHRPGAQRGRCDIACRAVGRRGGRSIGPPPGGEVLSEHRRDPRRGAQDRRRRRSIRAMDFLPRTPTSPMRSRPPA